MRASDNPYPYGSKQSVIFNLVTEEWPGLSTGSRKSAVDYVFTLDTDEYYTMAMDRINTAVYGQM
jgi:hypothetical protein